MLQAVELPARISHLATSLANVDRQTFPHFDSIEEAADEIKIKSY